MELEVRMTSPEALLGSLNEVERKNAPRALFVAGDTSILERGPRVSLVGSRRATPSGLAAAHRLSFELARRGAVVVSGLAEGIDTAAHRGAMEAGGRTIAVLGTPINRAFPAANRELQNRIGREHLLISQFSPETKTLPMHFPMRNRTMALIADATVIVEAGEKSGSLHQGWEALRLGRPLFFMEHVGRGRSHRWAGEFRRYGAQEVSVDASELILDFVPERRSAEAASPSY